MPRSQRDGSCIPKISVCIPTYQRPAPILEDTITSVLNQTYDDFELIVVDDHSTYDVERRLAAFKDARLRIIHQTFNVGIVRNFNTALSLARGTLFKPCCDDDILLPDCLAEFVRLCERAPLVVSGGLVIKAGAPWRCSCQDGNSKSASYMGPGLSWDALKGRCVTPTHVAFARCIWERFGPYNDKLRFAFDWDFYVRVRAASRVLHTAEPLVVRREWPGSATCRSLDPFRNLSELPETIRALRTAAPGRCWLLAAKCLLDCINSAKPALSSLGRGRFRNFARYVTSVCELTRTAVSVLRTPGGTD
jgi:glycosyltransferase involved in cell wall biosynthesis